MTFLWLHALWLLLALPGLIGVYFLLLRRRTPALRYSALGFICDVMTRGNRMRRHVPALLLLLSLVASIVAVARPATVVTLPSEQRTVILAIDVSYSMAAGDVAPTRLAAAKAAAHAFARTLPRNVRLGVIAFAGDADLVQPPTLDHDGAARAIEHLQLRSGTAIGTGIIASLLTLFPDSNIGGNYDIFGMGRSPVPAQTAWVDPPPEPRLPVTTVRVGSYTAAAIILLTDGRGTSGPLPEAAAKRAAQRGVRVYTVGFGQPYTTYAQIEGEALDVGFDDAPLKKVASVTGAEYFHASTGTELTRVYKRLSGRIVMERQETEVTALFAGLAAVLLAAAALAAACCGPRLNPMVFASSARC